MIITMTETIPRFEGCYCKACNERIAENERKGRAVYYASLIMLGAALGCFCVMITLIANMIPITAMKLVSSAQAHVLEQAKEYASAHTNRETEEYLLSKHNLPIVILQFMIDTGMYVYYAWAYVATNFPEWILCFLFSLMIFIPQ